MASEGETEDKHGNHAVWLIPRCKTLRESAGMRIQQLALAAKVDRATITKIEKHHGVSKPLAYRVFNELNKRKGGNLKDTVEITDSPRKR
jgi:DNA-binding XRE family transcriptional regulator